MLEGGSREVRYCFVAERQVGIGSAAQALEPHVRARGHHWCNVTYAGGGGILRRLPLPQRVRGTLRGHQQVRRALRQGPYDALFFLTHNPAVLQPVALARHSTVLWTDVTPLQLDRQAEQYDHPRDAWRVVRALKQAAVRNAFRRARLVVGWSEWARRSFVADYDVEPERTRVVPPGVDIGKWSASATVPRAGIPRLLFVGGNFERKGGKLLLEVFRSHLRGRAELDLVTRDAVAEEPGVRVHRHLTPGSPGLVDLYRRASVFVLPTQGDCFSIASLEAMAAGLPVVVSAVGGISDIVEHGQSGYLLRPGSRRDLHQALHVLLRDPAKSRGFGQRGRLRVETRFDAARSAVTLLGLLEEAAAAGPPRREPTGR